MKKKLRKSVLAEGEVTGHAHRLSEATEVFEVAGVREFETDGDTLTHEEHGPIAIPPGAYESGIAREFDPAEQAARQVRD